MPQVKPNAKTQAVNAKKISPQAKTYSARPADIKREWFLIDAASAPLGRVAGAAVKLLIGKHKPTYTPHMDGGDGVIVTNASKLKLTGNKLIQKRYYRHSGYAGNLKELSAQQLLERDPARLINLAVTGMLPKNKLQAIQLKRLRVFNGSEHGMEAQQPQVYEVANGK